VSRIEKCKQYPRLKRADSSDPRIFVKEFPGIVDVGSASERKTEELGMDFEMCGPAEFPDRKVDCLKRVVARVLVRRAVSGRSVIGCYMRVRCCIWGRIELNCSRID